MILAFTKPPVRRLATVGLVAMLVAACSVPTVTPSPAPSPLDTIPPPAPTYSLAPSMDASACPTSAPAAFTSTATVTMTTNFGTIVIKVDGSLGPNAAGSFLALARCGYYNNVIFHRIVPKMFIQAGDGTYARMPNPSLDSKMGTGGPGWNVADDPVTTKYVRGTVAMANTGSANSGGSQFFIVLSDTAFPAGTTSYAIFGNVTSGIDIADRISLVPTGGEPDQAAGGTTSMPVEPIVITSTIVTTP